MATSWNRVLVPVAALLIAGAGGFVVIGASCTTSPTPFIVQGPGTTGNEPPTLDILEPNANITRSQGDPFLIRWTDTDRDDNAAISFFLSNISTNENVLLASGIEENDSTGPDSTFVNTTLIPIGAYNVLGIIDDSVNDPVQVYATVAGQAVTQRLAVTIVGPGEGPQTIPPRITVTDPQFNLSVAQDDELLVRVQPADVVPVNSVPYDPDSVVRLFILLDLDLNPNNDDPANEDRSRIIVLRDLTIQPGAFQELGFPIDIDLATVPARPNGDPYYIRATVDDGTNPRVHAYAVGSISVVQLASGRVDLFDIGRTKSGARFYGFNPGANLGSSISNVGDFDDDGVPDFVMVARFGNPQNVGPVGEAYLVYGNGRISDPGGLPLPGNRFGGTIAANSIAETVSGVIFAAPPLRTNTIPDPAARTNGVTDVSFIRDVNADGRPEILFGLSHVHGAFDSTDFDPADESDEESAGLGCYPDFIVNNLSDADPFDLHWYAGGMAVMVNSTNRDSDGAPGEGVLRLDSTVVNLELAGQDRWVLDRSGVNFTGGLFARAHNANASNFGNESEEIGRIAGARFIAGSFDFIDAFGLNQPAREGLWGETVASIPDLNSDGLDEFVVSAPRNERYLEDLATGQFGGFSTHLFSTGFPGSITVIPGFNYNLEVWRDDNSDEGTAVILTQVDEFKAPPFGRCTPVQNREPRHFFIPADSFNVFAEDIDDWLGAARSAGDFNQDGLGDIACGAPLNDRDSARVDTGAMYIIYGRTTFGDVLLELADNTILRAPMLRVRGVKIGDQIGWKQTTGLDVNGDRIDDIFFSSPRADFGGISRNVCADDFNNDNIIDQTDLSLLSFNSCVTSFGSEVFSDDACKAFDYDNDGDIDDDDRCVFCCLSGDCTPSESCIYGTDGDCCANLVDNGFVGVAFGGVFINGDRTIEQLASSQLPGVLFFGGGAGDRAGYDVSSAGDFNQDGFGDLLISAPGRIEQDSAGRDRAGIVYLIFGGTHLTNSTWNLEDVGSDELPGIVFLSPFVSGRPNEAAPTTVAFIGDINNDGFGDIAIGNPQADFIDLSFPQGPDAPGSDAATGRRSNTGDVYVVYGNNFGKNRALP